MDDTAKWIIGGLLSLILLLIVAIITLAKEWIRSVNEHRNWAAIEINRHTGEIAAIRAEGINTGRAVGALNDKFDEFVKEEGKMHRALIRKLDLEIDEA